MIHRLLLPFAVMLLAAAPVRADWHANRQDKMGTRVEVRLWCEDAGQGAELLAAAMAEFDRIEAAMSTYRADSELSRINASAAVGPVAASPELYGLVRQALELSALTGGAFDITYDSVGRLYDYRAGRRPSRDAIARGIRAVGYQNVLLDREASTIQFDMRGVRLNLGGIAKGHAVESVVRLLREAGIRHAMVSAGGDTRLLGDRRGRPWVVGVRDPDDERGIVTRLPLVDEAISTSGDYERFFIEDGVRYHHILNPRTGRPAGAVRSVSVIGPDATTTDGLSTSVFVLGPAEGMALIESLDGYEAVIIGHDRRLRFSGGLGSGD